MTISSAFLSEAALAMAKALDLDSIKLHLFLEKQTLLHYLIHACAAACALALHRLAPILHGDVLRIFHLFLRFALYAISYFCHFKSPP